MTARSRVLGASLLAATYAVPAFGQCRDQILQASTVKFGNALQATGFDTGAGEVDLFFAGAPSRVGTGPPLQVTGAVLLFERASSLAPWVERQLLLASTPMDDAWFGSSLALSAGVLAVGAPREVSAPGSQGKAYVFEHDGTEWVETQALLPSAPHGQGRFGESLAFDGETLVATQPKTPIGSGGAVYVFEQVAGAWSEIERLTASDDASGMSFAKSVDVEGDWIAVGAPGTHAGVSQGGAAYLFARLGGLWTEVAKLTPPTSGTWQQFGDTIALEGEQLFVGAAGSLNQGQPWAVHIYDLASGSPVLVRTLHDPWPGGEAGRVVAVSGTTLLVAEDDEVLPILLEPRQSTVHVFRPADGSLPQTARLVDGRFGLDHSNKFGAAAAILDETILVAATAHGDDGTTTRVYSFEVPAFAEAFCHAETQAPCGNVAHHMGAENSLTHLGPGLMGAAFLGACGTPSVAHDDLRFDAGGVRGSQPALLFSGTAQVGPIFVGDGLRCAGGTTRRIATTTAHPNELRAAFGPGLSAVGGWQPGDSRYFQVWYRDPSAGPCNTGFNLTNGVGVTFTP